MREFRTPTESFNIETDGEYEEFKEQMNVASVPEEDKDQMCRFCWINEYSEDNPKVCTCECMGSVKYIHYKCLRAWLLTKQTTKAQSDGSFTLNWKTFECELCKMHYPYSFNFEGKTWNLIDIPRPEDETTPYIILESMNLEKNSSRIIHTIIINPNKKKFSLGRGHDSDLRINDISVSRLHATIEYKDEGYYLEDCKSKFGTLVHIWENIPVELQSHTTLQIGRTVVTLTARPLVKKHESIVDHVAVDQIQNPIPYFSTNTNQIGQQDLAATGLGMGINPEQLGFSSKQEVIEINGRRFLVLRELEGEEQAQE